MNHHKRLFAYTAWANTMILDAFDGWDEVPPDGLRFMSHITAASQIWLSRLTEGTPKPESVWPSWNLAECRVQTEPTHSCWHAYLETLNDEDLPQIIRYQDLSGGWHESSLTDILTHVANHATYHRAQIASSAVAAGHPAPRTDFILYALLA